MEPNITVKQERTSCDDDDSSLSINPQKRTRIHSPDSSVPFIKQEIVTDQTTLPTPCSEMTQGTPITLGQTVGAVTTTNDQLSDGAQSVNPGPSTRPFIKQERVVDNYEWDPDADDLSIITPQPSSTNGSGAVRVKEEPRDSEESSNRRRDRRRDRYYDYDYENEYDGRSRHRKSKHKEKKRHKEHRRRSRSRSSSYRRSRKRSRSNSRRRSSKSPSYSNGNRRRSKSPRNSDNYRRRSKSPPNSENYRRKSRSHSESRRKRSRRPSRSPSVDQSKNQGEPSERNRSETPDINESIEERMIRLSKKSNDTTVSSSTISTTTTTTFETSCTQVDMNELDNLPSTSTQSNIRIVKKETHDGGIFDKDEEEGEEESKKNSVVKEEPPSLVNIFDLRKELPKGTTYVNDENELPEPIMPKIPHYNVINPAEEREYEERCKDEPILNFDDNESDGEDGTQQFNGENDTSAATIKRYFKNSFVYDKYDFNVFKDPDARVLAVQGYKDQILDALKTNRVVVIEGFTGCGKTTQVPQFILDACAADKRKCNIVVTQPRKLAASSVATRICYERDWPIGKLVGYQFAREAKIDKVETMVRFMTTGVLLQKITQMKTIRPYTHIIIDEVHERDLDTDFLLLLLKKLLKDDELGSMRHVKIILMSATLDSSKFSLYFPIQNRSTGDVQHAQIIKIPKSRAIYKVDETYLDDLIEKGLLDTMEFEASKAKLHDEVYKAAVDIIENLDKVEREEKIKSCPDPRLHQSERYRDSLVKLNNRGAVLVFLPGMQEISEMIKKLKIKNIDPDNGSEDFYKWDIYPLHSSITQEEQQKVFKQSLPGRRKIIISTNIAESSITVKDIVYVIDFCLTKSLRLDSRTNFGSLKMIWASISQCVQRKGRTGRAGPGIVYRLVPNHFFKKLESDAKPEMVISGLEDIVLKIKVMNVGSPTELLALALDPPDLSGIKRAIVSLREVGALTVFKKGRNGEAVYDPLDGDLTFMGRVMYALPINHQFTRLILLGHTFGVMKECIIIAASLTAQRSPFMVNFNKRLEGYLSKLTWAEKSYSDCFALLNLYRHWTTKLGGGSSQNEFSWATSSSIHLKALKEIREIVEDIELRIKEIGLIPYVISSNDNSELSKEESVMIKIAIAGAFYPNYFHRQRPDLSNFEYNASRELNGRDLFTTVYLKGFPTDRTSKTASIYHRVISDQLAFGNDIPVISIEGQRVFATYDSSLSEKIGPIPKATYRAIKLRQINRRIEFNALKPHMEGEYYDRMIAADKERKKHLVGCPPQDSLPSISVSRVDVIITHVESPGKFWITYSYREKHLIEIERICNSHLNDFYPSDQVHPGAFCIAPFFTKNEKGIITAQTYYRARIRFVERATKKVLVYFVDYGNSEWVHIEKLKPFTRAHVIEINGNRVPLKEFSYLAIECRLAKVKPAIVYGSTWHEKAIHKFKAFTQEFVGFKFALDIYAVVKGVIISYLIAIDIQDPSQELNVNLQLIEDGFAEEVKESGAVEANHGARDKYHLIKDDYDQIMSFNVEQMHKVVDVDYSPSPRDGHLHCTLKGPYSPLEISFNSLCKSSSSMSVRIDDGSVNSVTLDHEPFAPSSRLVVAASVSIQDRNGHLVARDTTMMFATPGLMGLMGIIFAPRAEFRVDRDHSKYTGVLCGLGTDSKGDAIYMDHDLEIIFDTEINNDDIMDINRIRRLINLILREPTGSNISAHHKDVIESIIVLIKKPRGRVTTEVWPQESYVWNRIQKEFIISPHTQEVQISWENRDIFPPHSTVALHSRPVISQTWGDYDF